MSAKPPPSISVVVPVYNEEDNIAASYREISQALSHYGAPYEIIFVDDGSSDETIARLSEEAGADPHLRIIEFRRNFGQTAALAAGLDNARNEVVITMDGDLQNDPRDIPALIAKLQEGYDLVAGWRKNRQDPFINRRLPSLIANRIISASTKVKLHDYGCTLKAMTREVAQGIKLYGEMHRFIPALAGELGARITEMPVNHRARRFGTSKYGISRTLRVILDLITVKFLLGYSKRPIHLFGMIGLFSGGLGMLILLMMTYQRMFLDVPMGNRPLLSLGVMLVIIGLQFLVFGLLAEVQARTYYESQNKRIYVVRRMIEPGSEALIDGRLRGEEKVWNRKVAN